jgi:biotin synthase
MIDFEALAEKALRDEVLSRAECLAVLGSPDERLLDLLNAAYRVRERYFGRKVRLQMLLNAKSGACQEDCHYCSQSSVSTAQIDRYGLLSQEEMVEGAQRAAAAKAQRYCVVISGRSPLDREIAQISEAVRAIKREIPTGWRPSGMHGPPGWRSARAASSGWARATTTSWISHWRFGR